MTGPTRVVGLQREREVLTVALQAARHVVLEGPPGTGKSTLLRSIASELGKAVVFVEGNAELTPARLIGQYDPAQVLADGYLPSAFIDGPLLQAMRAGALLYLEEFNRVPEETLNVLITVLTEGEIAVPRLGMVRADEQFRLIAAMNPYDAIGTARVSQAIADRICRVVLGYQDANAERRITTAVSGHDGPVVDFAVALARATREHRDVRMGSSVRGAIDMVLLVDGLIRMRGEPVMSRLTAADAAYAALSGRIRIADGCDRSPESVLDELLERLWPAAAARPPSDTERDGQGKADGLRPGAGRRSQLAPRPDAGRRTQPAPPQDAGGPSGTGSRSSLRRDRSRGPSRRTVSRADLAARHESFDDVSPEPGALDADSLASLLAADPDAAAMLLADLALAADAELRAAARRLAARIFVQLGAARRQRARGVRRLGSGHLDGDLDLERTVERHSGQWPPPADQLVTRAWHAHRQAVCLLIDASGSMSGRALAIAAVAASAVVLAADQRLDTAVAAFGSATTVLQPLGARRAPEELVGDLLGLRGHGLTDIAAAFRGASAQLASGPAVSRRVVLLSDCQHTAGADPAGALAGIDRLDVLCPLPAGNPPGPDSLAAAQRLARIGGGVSRPVRALADVPAALSTVLTAH
jgi:magnesium chelatase subunit D